MREAQALAASHKGAMIAPAGCGKTEVIARAAANYGRGRELILTHTHAGVDALRRRLTKVGASRRGVHLDTIAGWGLRFAASFPGTSGVCRVDAAPRYDAVTQATAALLKLPPYQEVLRSSYSGLFVDEYQDCTIDQHALILGIADVIPCRIVGDPLQGIFGFGDSELVTWEQHVATEFEPVVGPSKPWRWAGRNERLGAWLQEARKSLLATQPLELEDAPVTWVKRESGRAHVRKAVSICMSLARNEGDSVVAIQQWGQQCSALAKKLRGLYSRVEAVELRELFDAAHRLDSATGNARAIAMLDIASHCMTRVTTELRTIRTALQKGRHPRVRKYRDQLVALEAVAESRGGEGLSECLQSIRSVPGTVVYRRELYRELHRVFEEVRIGREVTLKAAARAVRNRARTLGRRSEPRVVGTPPW